MQCQLIKYPRPDYFLKLKALLKIRAPLKNPSRARCARRPFRNRKKIKQKDLKAVFGVHIFAHELNMNMNMNVGEHGCARAIA